MTKLNLKTSAYCKCLKGDCLNMKSLNYQGLHPQPSIGDPSNARSDWLGLEKGG